MLKKNRKGRKKECSFLKSKRGTIFDIVPIITFAILFVIVSMIAYKVYNKLDSANIFTSTEAQEHFAQGGDAIKLLDGLFIFMVIGLGIAAMIAAVRIRTSPAFFFISVFLLALFIFLGAQFSNVFDTVASSSLLTTEAAEFDLSGGFLNNLPLFILGFGGLILFVMYSVNKFEI